MAQLTLLAPAKINLFLNIVGRRSDGYHELETVFQLLDFCDELTITPTDGIEVETIGLDLAVEDNLAYQAAMILKQATGTSVGAHIRLDKRIPTGAGLGGGSSDAAAVLVGLNHLWQSRVSQSKLEDLGLSLGADVPVFVLGHTAWAQGVGDDLQAIDLPENWFVVVYPGVSVSTARVFSHPDLTRDGTPITIARFLEEGSPSGDRANACEALVRELYPAVDEAVEWLSQWGPARMSGTGSSVFLEVPTEDLADEVLADMPPEWTAFKAKGINVSPLGRNLGDQRGTA